ncbi:hypothetical protein [Aureibacter tunicatorum]|uniref:Uncharacterized protein n=1 Tax=Aureibacter tunicatorum TaxID=866807 RepID=A0AAE3XJW3_9BACT|nr:hypothetical protein [Aureibacter tunicatorum]MDR6237121.1 hypothetical protein [Aureibacter tunicatorum]BDD06113.1 hypothetical protein AUTU_35960 [Aureibacter tunicatorum]
MHKSCHHNSSKATKTIIQRKGLSKLPPSFGGSNPIQCLLMPNFTIVSDVYFPLQGLQGIVFFIKDAFGHDYVIKLCETESALEREYFGSSFIRSTGSQQVSAPDSLLLDYRSSEMDSLKTSLSMWEEENAIKAFEALNSYKGNKVLIMEKVSGVPFHPIPVEFGGSEELLEMAHSPQLALALGEVAFYDLLLGNFDRLMGAINPHNLLVDPLTRLHAIDSSLSVFGQKYCVDKFAPELVGEIQKDLAEFSATFRPSLRSGESSLSDDWEMIEYNHPLPERKFELAKDKDQFEELLRSADTNPVKHREFNAYVRDIQLNMLIPIVNEILLLFRMGQIDASRLARSIALQYEKIYQCPLDPKIIDLGIVTGYTQISKKLHTPEYVSELHEHIYPGIELEAEGLLQSLYKVCASHIEKKDLSLLEKTMAKAMNPSQKHKSKKKKSS